MSLATSNKARVPLEAAQKSSSFEARPWWLCWEVYVFLGIAALLRLYGLQTTEFDGDQVLIYRIAYDALHHGWLVATSNGASINILNPPGVEYILMLPALFGTSVVWAAAMVAVLAIAGVLLTYLFTRRYYGRLAALFTTLLYAAAVLPVFYSRFIWQQNLLLFFVPLFIITLFRGVVSRRQGWFAPALALLGLLIQLHGSGILLSFALLAAWVLAPGTVRWRDIALGVLLVLVLYAPYIWWEVGSNFSDVAILRSQLGHAGRLDDQVWLVYQQFLGTYPDSYNNGSLTANALFNRLAPFVGWVLYVMIGLLCLALCLVVRDIAVARGQGKATRSSLVGYIQRWLSALRADPYRCGLLLLLVWQILPLLSLLHHSINLYPFYLLILMPGPFILIGILLGRGVNWLRSREHRWIVARVALYALVVALVVAQCTSSAAMVLDRSQGNFQDTQLSKPYYNDWNSLHNAFTQADLLAQSHHLRAVYVLSDAISIGVYTYFAEHTMHTPTLVFGGDCAVIPSVDTGPVAVLVTAHNPTGLALLEQFATAKLVSQPPRLGGEPFWLFIVQPQAARNAPLATFPGDVALQTAQSATIAGNQWIVTRWSILHSTLPAPRLTYTYDVTDLNLSTNQTVARPGIDEQGVVHQLCQATSWHAGDQLLLGSQVSSGTTVPSSLSLAVSASQTQPTLLSLPLPGGGHLLGETANYAYPSSILRDGRGQQRVTVKL
jgi:4-amino-4-deoxy-L-arabinose transferase-like glycosyltransferase